MVKVQNKNTFFCTKMKYCKDDDHKSKPSLCLQEEKNSVRLFRVDPVCIIITFSVRQRIYIYLEYKEYIYLPGSRLLRRQRRTAVSNTRHRTRRGRSSGEQEAFTSKNYYFDKKQQPRSLPYRLPIFILPTFEEWVCKKMTNGRSKNESPNKWLPTL